MQLNSKILSIFLPIVLFLSNHCVGKEVTLYDALNVHVYNTKICERQAPDFSKHSDGVRKFQKKYASIFIL